MSFLDPRGWLGVATCRGHHDNRGDRPHGGAQAIDRCAVNLGQVKSVLVDSGYTGQLFVQAVKDKLGANVQVAKRNELHTFAVIRQR